MTYEPLHHKYRPQTFADLVGQDAIATTLTNAIDRRRIVPAYLFTGPRGTGKTSSARILAKSLNCLSADGPTAAPCGTCAVCRGIANGSTLDVIEIDAASNTGVDNIRELIERAQFAPVQCRYKVYVIDECHMLSVAAFNALLKTLEEPPERVVFVLATTDPQRVLPTIISRCQRFDFRRIPLEPMVEHLEKIAQKEEISITREAVKMVAQIAQGGLRDAESLLDQLSLLAGEIDVERVWDLVGAVPERDLLELLKAIASEDGTTVIDSVRTLLNRGREPLIVLQNLAEFYRDLLIAKTAPQRSDLVRLTEPTWEELCQFAHRWEIPRILAAQKHLRESETQIKNTTQPRLWLEIILLGLLPSALVNSAPPVQPFSPQISPQPKTLTQPFVAPPPPPQNSPSPAPEPPPVFPPEPPEKPTAEPPQTAANQTPEPSPIPEEVHPEEAAPPPVFGNTEEYDLEEIWRGVLEEVQPFGTQQLLRQHGHLLSMNTEVACIGFPTQALYNIAKGKLSNIEVAFQRVFKSSIKVRLEVGTQKKNNPSPKASSSPKIEDKPVEDQPENKPTVSSEPEVNPPRENPQPEERYQGTSQPELPAEPPSVQPAFEPSQIPAQTPPPAVVNIAEVASQRLASVFEGKVIKLTPEIQLTDEREAKPLNPVYRITEEAEISAFEPEIDGSEDPTDEEDMPF